MGRRKYGLNTTAIQCERRLICIGMMVVAWAIPIQGLCAQTPLLIEAEKWTVPGREELGANVVVDGNRAFLGTRNFPDDPAGIAVPFRRDSGVWAEIGGPLTAGASGPGLLDFDGRFLVGTWYSSTIVYEWDGSTWDGGTVLPGGSRCAVDGDFALAGSTVHHYDDTSGLWSQHQVLPVGVGSVTSTDMSGDVIMIGQGGSGNTVYLFRYVPGTDSWIEDLTLTVPPGANWFGESVAVHNDLAVIGAPRSHTDDIGGGPNTGAVYIYRHDGANWNFEQKIVGNSVTPDGSVFGFGYEVAVRDNIIVATDGFNDGTGYVFEYDPVSNSWEESFILRPSSINAGAEFGQRGLALWGGLAFIGARLDNELGPNAGAVYVFRVQDCNQNGVADGYELLDGTAVDANLNGIPDECDDCNSNGILDAFDIADGTSDDINLNGIPDECEFFYPGMTSWVNPFGGQFSLWANWDNDTPTDNDIAVFDLDASLPILFDFDVVNEQVLFRSGAVMLDLAGQSYELSATKVPGLILGATTGDDASVTVENGVILNDSARVGGGTGSIGSMILKGTAAQWTSTDTLCIGCNGSGSLFIQDGATVIAADAVVGDEPGAIGSVDISDPVGTGSHWLLDTSLQIKRGSVVLDDLSTIQLAFGNVIISRDGELSGTGTVIADSVVNLGTVTVGMSTGSLTVDGRYRQAGSGVTFTGQSGSMNIELNGSTPGIEHDVLNVTGAVELGGGLILDFGGGFAPSEGTQLGVVQTTIPIAIDEKFDVVYIRGLPANKVATVGYNDGPLSGTGGVSVSVINLADAINYEGGSSSTIDEPPSDAVLADLLSDPSPDLAVAMPGANQVAILQNDGSGGFVQTQLVTVGTTPSGIVAGELNGLAGTDLAVSNAGDGTVSILSNDGAGTFTETLVVSVGSSPSAVEIGLFDGDAVLDLATSNAGDDTVTILLNDGNAASFTPSTVQVGAAPSDLRAGAFDDDTTIDLAVTLEDDDAVRILTGDGLGAFAAAVLLPTGPKPKKIDPKDLDQDKDLDLVTVHQTTGEISVLLNNGDGTFAPSVELAVGSGASSLTSLDMDGDGDEDLAIVAQSATLIEPVVRLLRNDLDTVTGQLTLTLLDDELAQGEHPVVVLSGDVDLDGQQDVVTVGENTSPLSGAAEGIVRAQFNLGVCAGDTDGDHDVDIQDLLEVLANWGPNPGHPADVNGDDAVDIVDLLALLANWGSC